MILEVLNYIKHTGKTTLHMCDVGWGYGYDDTFIRNVVRHYYPNVSIEVDLFDPDIDFYRDTIHKKQDNINYYSESFLTINMDQYQNKYDLIVCSEVIEHLWWAEQEICFTNFNKILKRWGLILLTTPNGSSIIKTLYGLIKRKRWDYDTFLSEHNHRYAHIGIPTLFQVIGLFVRKGFKVDKIIPSAPTSWIPVTSFHIMVNKLFKILLWVNLFFSTDNLYVVRKSEDINTNLWYNTLSAN